MNQIISSAALLLQMLLPPILSNVVNGTGGGGSEPSVTVSASFTARPIQGSTCVAPCAVHFDAIGLGALSTVAYVTEETTDTAYSREFHTLRFTWDFGDSGDSCGATWEYSGLSKNVGIGGLAGHTYCDPGTYTVTLTVANPAGEESTTQETVTVVDPDTEFTEAETWCFANTAGTFQGCPLDDNSDGTCGAGESAVSNHCVVTSDLDLALTSGTVTEGCNSDDAGTRCMFAVDDTFTNSASPLEPGAASPVLIESFGPSSGGPQAKPIFALGTTEHRPVNYVTFKGIQTTGTGTYSNRVEQTRGNVTWYDCVLNYSGSAHALNLIVGETSSQYATLVALVETDIISSAGRSSGTGILYGGANYMMWQGGLVDNGVGSTGVGYTFRGLHEQHWLGPQHVRMQNAIVDHLQFRADDSQHIDTEESHNMFVLVSDNDIEVPGGQGGQCFKTCADSGCNCQNTGSPTSGSSGCGASGSGHIVSVHDFIFERNVCSLVGGGTATVQNIVDIEGGSFTIRNNAVHTRSTSAAGTDAVFVRARGEVAHWSGFSESDYIHVFNNTIVMDNTGYTGDQYLALSNTGLSQSGCSGNCLSYGNLVVVGSLGAGGSIANTDGTFTNANALGDSDGTDPFDGTMPASGSEAMADFVPLAGHSVVDTGYDFSGATDFGNALDGRGLCRPEGSGWDIGAIERSASVCY